MTADTTPSLVERLTNPIAQDFETTVQMLTRWRAERQEAASYITELEGREHRVCAGCGHSMSDAEIVAHPTAVSCCPERKMLTAAEWAARAEAAEANARRLEGLWSWWGERTNLSLDHDYPEEREDGVWIVHRVSGGINDREWEEIAIGETPLEAVTAAHAVFTTKEADREAL